jgi:hypothetical protein
VTPVPGTCTRCGLAGHLGQMAEATCHVVPTPELARVLRVPGTKFVDQRLCDRAAGLVKGQRGAGVRVQHPLVDRDCEHWEWCLLCEKAGPVLDWKGGAWKCPSCGLGGALDMWPWSKVRALNPSYPECPLWDVVYPLYGEPVTDTVTDSEAPGV